MFQLDFCFKTLSLLVLWHVDPLLGNNREISSYTTAVASEWPQQISNNQQRSNLYEAFYTRSVR
jgi:hypothetical protein